jgi:hypothetical protein
MNQKEIACKIANNILEFLIDPTVVPVRQHLYFRPEEILRNESYEEAKADAQKAYGDQRHNSDFYPIRNRTKSQKEASIMDRKTLIASLDVLSQNFNENDPIGTDLRTMAYAVSKMADEELEQRTANAWMDLMEKVRNDPKNEGKSVKEISGIAQGLYKKANDECVEEKEKKDSDKEAKKEVCPKCGKSECACMKEASEEVIVNDFWTKETSDAVAKALMAEVESPVEEQQEEHEKSETPAEEKKENEGKEAGKIKGPGIPDGTGPKCQMDKKEDDKEAGQNDPRFMYQHSKKEVESKKEEVAPVEPKKEEVSVVEPIKEAKKEEVLVEEPKKEEVEAKKIVDTNVLATQKFDDVELTFASEDVGELTASEKAQLDQLFK